ncbi:ATP-binding cassette domain-containing protein [Komagataeibacter rhaeticus]|nr:ATP-binding cassette domain-containing protein [Komagataeibacter rhaeticus]
MFQNYALFPHLSVGENVAFPLRIRKVDRAAMARRTEAALEMVGLHGYAARMPAELSGGQQQRVALARCLVYRPSLILMDESFSALDRNLRLVMQDEVRRIHRETGTSFVFVTHDQEEAMTMSDRICLMNQGRIEQFDTPRALYATPRTVLPPTSSGHPPSCMAWCARAGCWQPQWAISRCRMRVPPRRARRGRGAPPREPGAGPSTGFGSGRHRAGRDVQRSQPACRLPAAQ